MISVSIPFPPSVNNLFVNARKGKGRFPSDRYKAWLEEAGWALKAARQIPLTGDVTVDIVLCPPDKRRRDIDNLAKAPLDLLVKHGLISDDSEIVELRLRWGEANGALITVRAA